MESDLDKMKELLEENIEINKDVLTRVQKIEKYLKWQKIWGITKILLIAVPVVLSLIYLPPLLKEAMKGYQELFELSGEQKLPIDVDLKSLGL